MRNHLWQMKLVVLATVTAAAECSLRLFTCSPSSLVRPSRCFFGVRPESQNLRLRGGGACFGCVSEPVEKLSDTVDHEFVVFFEEAGKTDNFAPAIVGSWQGWNVQNATLLYRDAGHVRWSAAVNFPRKAALDEGIAYKYVLVPTDAEATYANIVWENFDNRILSFGNTTLSSTMGDNSSAAEGENVNKGRGDHFRHKLNCAPSCTDVCFEATYVVASPSEFVAVVGSSRVLGKWNTEWALRLSGRNDTWKACVAMPFPLKVEFKFVVLDSSDFHRVLWEGGPNRVCTTSVQGIVEMLPSSHVLQAMTETTPPKETMIKSPSMENISKKSGRTVGAQISRLKSFQRVFGVKRH